MVERRSSGADVGGLVEAAAANERRAASAAHEEGGAGAPSGRAFRFRSLRSSDMPGVLAIERRLFSNPWEESAFQAFLRAGLPFSRVALVKGGGWGAPPPTAAPEAPPFGAAPDASAFVSSSERAGATTPGMRVAGYALGWCDGAQAELMNLAVDASWQGRSLGAALLDWVLATCSARGAAEIFLEVRASNGLAQRLYRRHGFRECGRRRGYYDNPPEDGLVFRAPLDGGVREIDSLRPRL